MTEKSQSFCVDESITGWSVTLSAPEQKEKKARNLQYSGTATTVGRFTKRTVDSDSEVHGGTKGAADAIFITFFLTNTNILPGGIVPRSLANVIHGSRLRWLKKLRVIVNFNPLSFATMVDSTQRRVWLGVAFSDVVDGFVDALDFWKCGPLLDLEIH
ncbi:hypothetical protein LX36DRAFT_735024 [Colletotrichum falcatum]|nr:hypothetical protein LX36DRAFT_735024 [Colletotrichum falcatum]